MIPTPKRKASSFFGQLIHHSLVMIGAVVMTLVFFLVLPLLQAISKPPSDTYVVPDVSMADVSPPPAPPEEEPEQEEVEEEPPPELAEDAPPLDLSQLEIALNAGPGDGWGAADFTVNLKQVTASAAESDALFNIGDLDQKPRVIYQASPNITSSMRKILRKGKATVYIIFIVDKNGRVVNPIVQKSPDSVFEGPALAAVRQWKFEPGKSNGKPVRFRMRVPITFPQQ